MPNNFKTILLYGVIWGVLIGGITSAFKYFNAHGKLQSTLVTARSLPAALPACGPLPGLGTTSILDGGTLQRENVSYGVLAIKNEQPVTVVAVLADSTMTRRYQVITVGAASEVQVKVPSGQYGFGIMSGRTWCSLDRGFTDGTRHSINGGVTVKPESTTQAILGTDAAPGEISLLYRNLYRTEELGSDGLEVRQSLKGYVTPGTVNGRAASFMIDTGASHATLPAWLAEQAGIRCNQTTQYSTAAGFVSGCKATAAEVSFGPFRLQNVEVAIIAGGENAFLGMDVLRRFNMVWRGDSVRITSLDSGGQLQLPGAYPSKAFAPVVPWITPALSPAQFMSPVVVASKPDDGKFWWVPALLVGVGVLFWGKLREQKQSKAHSNPASRNDYYYNPKEFRAERPTTAPARPQQPVGTPQSRLLLACGGDRTRMTRLMEYETRKDPSISDVEAVRRAIDRLERERH